MGGLGFKEIEKFSEALLAKQVWRMINNPNSLCYRVFKVRFFPNRSILEAKDLVIESYAWKSIISARDVIRRGMVWRVGDAQLIRIKEDKWLPVRTSYAIISPLPSVLPQTKVNELIDPDLITWKTERVKQMFFPHEASMILGISLSLRKHP